MMLLLSSIAILTAFLRRSFSRAEENRINLPGRVFIVLSGLYFSAVFLIAHLCVRVLNNR
jgi:hypothetical protein